MELAMRGFIREVILGFMLDVTDGFILEVTRGLSRAETLGLILEVTRGFMALVIDGFREVGIFITLFPKLRQTIICSADNSTKAYLRPKIPDFDAAPLV